MKIERKFAPGTIFEAQFEWTDDEGNPLELWVRGQIFDWHFKVHNFTKEDHYWDILIEKRHLSYSYELLDMKANNEELYELYVVDKVYPELYYVGGRELYLNTKEIIEIPDDIDEKIASLKPEFYRAYVLEEAAAKVIRDRQEQKCWHLTYWNICYIYDFCKD